ncbi:hypothetical protein BKA61DRAFT_619777 [Leptodontidium sp. MPI-SDFR-AT-0119]|nr:hypothetical protein BKA61DRAFT_619777 [Leptodontidium sp. MPI-SDFR-AT-0119]
MACSLNPLSAVLFFISALTLAFPTDLSSTTDLSSSMDLSSTPDISSIPSTSTTTDTSSLTPSIKESDNYVCEEGCRRPCFDYGYCSSCDDLTGWEYVPQTISPPLFYISFFQKMRIVGAVRRKSYREKMEEKSSRWKEDDGMRQMK